MRVAAHGERLIHSRGLDFNQFTYWGLGRRFNAQGFSRVVDIWQMRDSQSVSGSGRTRRGLCACCESGA
jgi:hypothetical protein